MLDYDIDKMCRVCLQTNLDLFLLFDEQNAIDGVCLSNMISEMTIYAIRRHDDFPHQICSECMQKVRSAYELKTLFERSHRKLLTYLESNNKIVDDNSGDVQNNKGVQTDDSTLFPCEKCDAKFISYQSLRDHRTESHKGSENICRFCSRKFNRIGDLKNHIAVHHPEVQHFHPHECLICNRRFTRKEHVNRHMAKIHKLESIQITPGDEDSIPNENIECDANDLEMLLETEADYENLTKVDDNSEIVSNKDSEDYEVNKDDDDDDDEDEDNGSIGTAENPISSDEDDKPLAGLRDIFNTKTKDPETLSIKEELDDTLPEKTYCAPKTEELKTDNKESYSLSVKNHQVLAKPFKCSKCSKTFTRRGHLKRHFLSHDLKKKFICNICSKRFSRKDHLKSHMNKHDPTKAFKCEICDRSYFRAGMVRKHKEMKHNMQNLPQNIDKPEHCKVCNKTFSTKAYLQKHMNMHTNKSFKCKICPTGFESKEALKQHNKSHGKEKPFLCSECGLRFVRNDYLLIHMRRHTGEKPFTCKYCGKGFPRKTDLNVHVKYHTGEKTHLCTICGKGFQRSYNLVVHMRVHTGERPYQCVHCPKNFAQGNDLKAHIRRHTGERYKCHICEVGFVQGYLLTQHKISVHGLENEARKGRVSKVKPNKTISIISEAIDDTSKAIDDTTSLIKREPHSGVLVLFISKCLDSDDVQMLPSQKKNISNAFVIYSLYIQKCKLSQEHFIYYKIINPSLKINQNHRTMEFDIEKMCRVCLKTNLDSVLLFEEPKKIGGVSICDMISELTIYKVHRHDEFPHLICYECMERVESAYSFKKDFEQAHRKLITYLDSINKYQAVADIKPIPTEEKSTQTIDSTLYPCEKCDQKFIKYERLREHRAIAHKGSANMCRICNKSFNRLAGLKSHISAAHPEIGYHNSSNQCYVCNKMFTRRDHVTRHIRNVHKIATSEMGYGIEAGAAETEGDPSSQIFEEGECNEEGVVKGELKPYIECLVCYKHFSSKNRLNRHMQTIHQLDPAHILKQEQNNEMNTFESEMELLAEPEAFRNYTNEDDGEISNDFDNEGGGGDNDDEEDDDDDDDDDDGDNDGDNDDGLDTEDEGAIKNTEFVAANSFIKCETELTEPTQDEVIKKVTIKQEKAEFNFADNIYTAPPPQQEKRQSTFDCFHRIEDGKYGCNLCEKTFKSSYHVKRHFLSHTQEKAFHCTMCEMRFNRADHLKNHMTKHNPVKPFQCDNCGASYGRADHLKRHKEMHHSNDPNSAPVKGEVCEYCNKSYSSKAYLQKHLLKHTEKCWKCKLCSVVFETNEALKEHSKTHSKDKPFLCSECGLCFPRKNYLIIHMRRHNGERPYKCQYCDKGFPRSTDLKAHEKCHTGEKTHFCNVCGKGFPRPYKLSVHMRIHTGEKPYQCMHCPKAFAQCNDLKAHIRRHTGERFRCELCGAGFIQKYNLTQHKADAHGIINESRLGRVAKIPIAEPIGETMTSVINNSDEKLQMGLSTNLLFRGVALH
ncbi:zinc finger protein 91-like [Eupeodes corollae]|uniref:zinc finger protein 91-like n=1 Tax=Eupeodes corollae TaxID=290404 RepID=UPI00248FABFD|nr:zinc finger protein 91-like [Eupeodes corollae]